MSFDSLLSDRVVKVSSDGSRSVEIKASVQGSKIFINNVKTDWIEGDVVERALPSGRIERFQVTDARFNQGPDGLLAHWELTVQKVDVGGNPANSASRGNGDRHVTINNSSNVQIGNGNMISMQDALANVIRSIDQGPGDKAQKQEVKSRFRELFAHPLVVAVVGAAAGEFARRLGGQ